MATAPVVRPIVPEILGAFNITGDLQWATTSITYSLPDTSLDYETGYFADFDDDGVSAQSKGFAPVTLQQIGMIQSILDADLFAFSQQPGAAAFSVEGFTNLAINFVSGGSGDGIIRIANTKDKGLTNNFDPGLWATYPGWEFVSTPTFNQAFGPQDDVYGGDIFLGTISGRASSGNVPGQIGWFLTMRAIGQSLGLTMERPVIPGYEMSIQTSIMSDREYINATSGLDTINVFKDLPQSFMMDDIAALQNMYGADYTTNSGDTRYAWNVAADGTGSTYINGKLAILGQGRTFLTIWDGGGNDTYDFSNMAMWLDTRIIDLRPGHWSKFAPEFLAEVDNGSVDGIKRWADGNVANAWMYKDDTRSLIENVVGTISNDDITGNQVDNVLEGGGGNDILKGLQGNDLLKPGVGSDTLDGGDGSDTVDYTNLISSITVTLGAGASNVTFGALVETDSVVNIENVLGGSANDRITGNAADNLIRGGAGSDTVNGGDGNDTVDFSDRNFKLNVTLNGANAVNAYLGVAPIYAEIDVIRNFENVIGTAYDDTITGDGLDNRIEGRSGIDVLIGNAGRDTIDGGNGNDTITAGDGDDTIIGSAGSDTINGGNNFDIADYSKMTAAVTVVLKGATATTVTVGGKTDTMTNVEGIIGGSGNDNLTGYAGRDALSGGSGNDTITVADNDFLDGDYWDGGSGVDRLSFASQTWGAGTSTVLLDMTQGRLTAIMTTVPTVRVEVMTGFENLTGSQSAETIVGTNDANSIQAQNGDDTVYGMGGADILDGDGGNDKLQGGAGNDAMNGGDGSDTADFSDKTTGIVATLNVSTVTNAQIGAEIDTLVNIENMLGGTGNDTLTGDIQKNTLSGGAGDDTLDGGANTDIMTGGDGNDRLLGGEAQFNYDSWDGGAGTDTLDFSAVTWTGTANQVVYDLNTGSRTFSGFSIGAETILNIENVSGGQGAETIYGADNAANELSGNGGGDVIDGRSGNDTIEGGNGSDTLHGGEGDDTISDDGIDGGLNNVYGDDGNDVLVNRYTGSGGLWDGGTGNDTIDFHFDYLGGETINLGAASFDLFGTTFQNFENAIGSEASETIIGSAEASIIAGYYGFDTLDGAAGIDTVTYLEETQSVVVKLTGATDSVVKIGGIDVDIIRNFENVTGGSGADQFLGDSGANILLGGAGNDFLSGMLAADALLGGDGDDTLRGGKDQDIIDGGAGIDTADFADKMTAVTVALLAGTTVNSIVDGRIEDTLAGIENLSGGTGDDRFTGDTSGNVLKGQSGNDAMNGGDGDDILQGGLGADALDGGAGIDTADYSDRSSKISITLKGSTDSITITDGSVTEDVVRNIENVTGGSNDDTLIGDSFANRLLGGAGQDYLRGSAGITGLGLGDYLDGGNGIDTADLSYVTTSMTVTLGGGTFGSAVSNGGSCDLRNIEFILGGSGNDTLLGDELYNSLRGNGGDDLVRGGGGADQLFGGDGSDTASYSDKAQSVSVTLVQGSAVFVRVNGVIEDTIDGFENLVGGMGNDTLTGDSADNVIRGEGGVDILDGGLGIDTVDFRYQTKAFSAQLVLGAQSTVTVDGTAADKISNFENILGGQGNDVLSGNGLNNTLDGYLGNDNLLGGAGNDRLLGGDGDDVLAVGQGSDTIDGGAGYDTIAFTDRAAGSPGVIFALSDSGSGTTFMESSSVTYSGIENINGSSEGDELTGSSLQNIIDGGTGNDKMKGGGGDDVLNGGEGADNIDGGAGNDLFVDADDDRNDVFTGGDGEDIFRFTGTSGAVLVGFNGYHDKIQISHELSPLLTQLGSLDREAYAFADRPREADDVIVRDQSTGIVSLYLPEGTQFLLQLQNWQGIFRPSCFEII